MLRKGHRRTVEWVGVIGPKLNKPTSKSSSGPQAKTNLVLEAQLLEDSSQVVVEGPKELETHQMWVGEVSGLEAPMYNPIDEDDVAI